MRLRLCLAAAAALLICPVLPRAAAQDPGCATCAGGQAHADLFVMPPVHPRHPTNGYNNQRLQWLRYIGDVKLRKNRYYLGDSWAQRYEMGPVHGGAGHFHGPENVFQPAVNVQVHAGAPVVPSVTGDPALSPPVMPGQ
jgi:hypothetical protein